MSTTLADKAYDYIAGAIAEGEIQPGSTISEQSVARRLNVSRTPVREAIRRLQQEGVVEQVQRYGTIVCYPDRNRFMELYELREALECYAVERATERISSGELERLGHLVSQLRDFAYELRASGKVELDDESCARFLDVDMAFHMCLLEAAGNRSIIKAVRDSRALTGIFGVRREAHDLSVLARSYMRHRQVYRAVKSGKGNRAREILGRHVRESREKALHNYDINYGQPSSRQYLQGAILRASQ